MSTATNLVSLNEPSSEESAVPEKSRQDGRAEAFCYSMARVTSHDIRNALNGLKTGIFSLRPRLTRIPAGEQTAFREFLDDAAQQLSFIESLTTDLDCFTRPNSEWPEPVSLCEVVNQSLAVVADHLPPALKLNVQIEPNATLSIDRYKLGRVIVNLLRNAAHALSQKQFTNEQPTIWIESFEEPDCGGVSIRDNGCGIAPQDLERVFDASFTTKPFGEGWGVGLTICRHVLEEAGGTLTARRTPVGHTEFTVAAPSNPH